MNAKKQVKIKRPTVAERIQVARDQSYQNGRYFGNEEAKKELALLQANEKTNLIRAAGELAQANAKLTYAMSRMLTGKEGW